jgi:hypothetical protein
MAEPELRAADVDRERVAERLRRAHGEGRISLLEFDERVAAAYAARTYGELAPLTADLPPEQPDGLAGRAGTASGRAAREAAARAGAGALAGVAAGTSAGAAGMAAEPAGGRSRHGGKRLAWRIEAASWLFASVVNLVIWGIVSLASGVAVYPWWIWVAGPWGAVLLLRLVTGRGLCRAV